MPPKHEPTLDYPRPGERRRTLRRAVDLRLRQRDRELEAAQRISEALFEHLSPDEVVEKALQTALEVVDAENGSILLADASAQQLVFRHSIGASPVQSGTAIPWEKGIAGAVFHSGQAIVISDVQQDPRHCPDVDVQTQHVTRDMIALPLKRWEGHPIGVIEVLNKRGGRLDQRDVALLGVVSAIAASSIEQARLYHEARLAEVVRLLGNISHDIKNLLMPVFTGAGLLSSEIDEHFRNLPDVERTKAQDSYKVCQEILVMFGTATRRIQDHVKGIADCVQGLSTEPIFTPCRVARVVKAVFEALSWQADQRGVSLLMVDLDRLPEIRADERRLFNAVYNLVNNAIPEVPRGGWIRVSGELDPTGHGVVIRVADNGRGMPSEVRDRLFTDLPPTGKTLGTGLGLKIVKDTVTAHGGRMVVDSALDGGTTFHLHLPLCPPFSKMLSESG